MCVSRYAPRSPVMKPRANSASAATEVSSRQFGRLSFERAGVHHVGGDVQDHPVIPPHGVPGAFEKSGEGGIGSF